MCVCVYGVSCYSSKSFELSAKALREDFTFRLLCIHERRLAGMPVIIEGLTGVGKTFPIKVYAADLRRKDVKIN